MAAEGKTVKSGGGFGGSGFKFDENEASYSFEKKKFQKTVFGLQVIVQLFTETSSSDTEMLKKSSDFKLLVAR